MEDFSRLVARSDSQLPIRIGRGVVPLVCACAVTVFAQSGPVASVSTPVQYGTIAYGSTLTMEVPVTNTGGSALTISPSINGPSYKVVGSAPANCQLGTPAGQTCTLEVEFSPVTVGPHDDNLTLQTNGSSSPVVKLRGVASGVGSQMEGPVEFPTIPFGTSRVQTIRIDNVGIAGKVTFESSVNAPSFKLLNTSIVNCGPRPKGGRALPSFGGV